ncbi:uncharacterized protein PG986_001464 [Apiospora aurea]|uniref:Uncharacterized protein n=1 Tax=Apiospora aurea TaxID=335848 RepID=A0ABR1QXK2_9PEZI
MVIKISHHKRGGRRDLLVYPCSINTSLAAGTHIAPGLPETGSMVVHNALKTQQSSSTSSSSSWSWAPVPRPRPATRGPPTASDLKTLLPSPMGSHKSTRGTKAGLDRRRRRHVRPRRARQLDRHHVVPERCCLLAAARAGPWSRLTRAPTLAGSSAGQAVVLPPPPLGGAEASGGLTRLRWDVQDSGPSPRVQCQQQPRPTRPPRRCSPTRSTIAAGHSAPPVTRRSSEAWDCIEEELTLLDQAGQAIGVPRCFVNTRPGDIHRRAAHRVRARILAREPSGDVEYDEEDIRLRLRPEDLEQPNPILDRQSYERVRVAGWFKKG